MTKHRRTGALLSGIITFVTTAGCERWAEKPVREQFLRELGTTSVTVFPIYLRQGSKGSRDADAAQKIVSFLQSEHLARARVSSDRVPLSGAWHVNEARMSRESGNAFGAHLKTASVATRYALLAE